MVKITADHYSYRVRWSMEDDSYVGSVAEFASLSWIEREPSEAFDGIRRLVAEVLSDMVENGETPPPSLSERTYSGKFMVRITPEQHRRLALEAAEQHVSMNRLVSSRLIGV